MAQDVAGHDAVIASVSGLRTATTTSAPTQPGLSARPCAEPESPGSPTPALLEHWKAPPGLQRMDTPDFPEGLKGEAAAQRAALTLISDAGHEPEDAAHPGMSLVHRGALHFEPRPRDGEPRGGVGEPPRRRLCLHQLAVDPERGRTDAIDLRRQSRAAALQIAVELEATERGICCPTGDRAEEHTEGDPDHHSPKTTREYRPNETVLRWSLRRGVEQSGSSPGS